MYKPTIWQDHVEGVQEGTDMNAKNFNNIEAGLMEASAFYSMFAELANYRAVVQGITAEGWRFRKWASGDIECWIKWPCWRSDDHLMLCEAPVLPTSITEENIQATIVMSDTENNYSDRVIKCKMSDNRENAVTAFVFSADTWSTSAKLDLYISVKGRWK